MEIVPLLTRQQSFRSNIKMVLKTEFGIYPFDLPPIIGPAVLELPPSLVQSLGKKTPSPAVQYSFHRAAYSCGGGFPRKKTTGAGGEPRRPRGSRHCDL